MLPSPAPLPRDACLFLDVDGTLLDIAPTPDAVRVPAGLPEALLAAERALGGALALVSGRAIADLDRIFAPLRLRCSGAHGAEVRLGGAVEPRAEPVPPAAWAALRAALAPFPALITEDKGFSFAVHYRAAPELAAPLREALDGFAAARPELGLAVLPGHSVFELKRSGVDKGGAVAFFLRHPPFAGRRPVFVGDDVTDGPGLAAAAARGGLGYAVGRALPGAAAVFPDPEAVRRWLAAL